MDLELQICSIIDKISNLDERLTEIVEETEKDEDLQTMKEYVENGWPTDKRKAPDNIKYLYSLRN